jgi:putative ABC transport system substrate-binding protein
MRRRTVIAGLAALCLAPQRSSAQQSQGKIPRVGILTAADTERTRSLDAFRQGLRDLGYIEGRNIILEFRLAHGDYSLFPQLTAELVALPVDVVVSEGGVSLVAKASGPVPVVVPTIFDPVGQGVATSLSRPGGNVTGFTLMSAELDAKRLALLRSTFPQVTAVSALMDPANPMHKAMLEGIGRAAASMSLPDPRRVEAESVAALRALRPAVFSGTDAVIVVGSGLFWNYRQDVVALLNEARLPAIYPERDYIDDGGLMSYGANVPDNFRRAADYVDRILKGAKPGDLPIQEPVRFDFVVNLKTARELGLTIPRTILLLADEVIE